jgi:hypothetical protein
MQNRTLAKGRKNITRFETHVYPNSRRRFAVTRTREGKIVSMVHLATVSDPTPKERW